MVAHRLTETAAQTGGMTKGQFLSPGMLKTGAMAASVAGCVFLASPAHQALAAPGPFLPHGIQGNPLPLPVGASMLSRPALVDIDADGDIDIFVGDKEGTIHYFENIGTASAPAFEVRTGSDSPFWYYDTQGEAYYPYDVGDKAAPTFVDIDNDGDLDAFVGSGYGYGSIKYFENIGTASAPEFTPYTGTDTFGNPFGISAPPGSTPAFADIDGDGDMDLFTGYEYGNIFYFENIGTASAAMFSTGQNPLNVVVGDGSAPAFADIDGDGDLDAFIGSKYDGSDVSYGILGPIVSATGGITYYENVGSASAPVFSSGEAANPFAGLEIGKYSAPAFADIDGDGDLDAFVGGKYGNLEFFENTGTVDSPVMTKRHLKGNPAWGADVGFYSKPTFVDIDGDGDLDAFVGEFGTFAGIAPAVKYPAIYGNINFFENIGTAENPDFVQREGAGNPMDGALGLFEMYSSLSFVDIDGDGDMDAFVATTNDLPVDAGLEEQAPPVVIQFFKNIGTATAPDLVAMPAENPLADLDIAAYTAPVFVDFDGDGDMDAFIYDGEGGRLLLYENVGTPTAPDFFPPFPFTQVDVGDYGVPALFDADSDGDMDLFMGTAEGMIHYFENTGTPEVPIFTKRVGADNPFDAYEMILRQGFDYTAPAAADIDGDGDIDLFVGEAYGRILFFENRQVVVEDGDDDGAAPVITGDSDTCFIDSAVGAKDSGQTGLFSRITGQVYGAVRSMLRP